MTSGLARAPRFHVAISLAPGAVRQLPPDAGHHASRVLRLREGDSIVLFNGAGGEYSARIVGLSRDGVTVDVGPFDPVERESPLAITLVQGISAGDRMDLTIQKAVELGVHAVQPILAERSVVRLKGERGDSRREHWQRVAVSACEQCGRNRVPVIATALDLANYVPADASRKVLLSPDGEASLASVVNKDSESILLAVGPEAGFTQREVSLLVGKGFVPARFGPRVLRTETAGPAAISALNALHGDG
jgi:16S rRNA (uracil1498-N3)-methyltransferase